jgi:hypothetical protein
MDVKVLESFVCREGKRMMNDDGSKLALEDRPTYFDFLHLSTRLLQMSLSGSEPIELNWNSRWFSASERG